jgi:biotin operon repressor
MRQLKADLDQSKREIEILKSKIQRLQEEHGIDIDKSLETDLEGVMEDSTSKVHESHPPGSFLHLFWDHQLQAIRTKDRRQIRRHPMIVKWCLNLKLMSCRTYNALRSTLVLPSERTLRDYTHCFDSKPGFDHELDKQLMKEAQVDTIHDFQKYVCLVFDEVRVKEGLVYDKHSLQVIGFVNVGDINNQLLKFERAQTRDSQEAVPPPLAKHMLVFMVRGIFSRLEFPYVQFPCASTSGDVIFPLVWECIKRLEACGLKVIATTADGASANRKFFKMHKQASGKDSEVVYKTVNVYSPEKRPLFFISDVPHLIKTVCNCWSNSGAHNYTRTMKVCII